MSCTISPVLELGDALKGHLLAHYVDVRVVSALVLQHNSRPSSNASTRATAMVVVIVRGDPTDTECCTKSASG